MGHADRLMPSRKTAVLTALLVGACAVGGAGPAAAETRAYVISYFGQAASNTDGDCEGGINPEVSIQFAKNLAAIGKTPQEIETIIARWREGKDNGVLRDLMNERGRIDGKPVNAYAHPAAVVDPQLNSVTGRFAYGFDLDGKGADDPDGFIDPETAERGIDNQFFRAMGCSRAFRGTVDNPSAYWEWIWTTIKDSTPAWLMSVSGENLAQDGPVTITFDRALEFAKSNPDGRTRPYMTYRVDPDPRSHNVFSGEIRDGVVHVTGHGDFFMLQSALFLPEIALRNTHLRMTMRADGSLDGFLGGYQSWRELYFGLANGGTAAETTVVGETPGMFYLLRGNADADPDPETGENRAISAVYRLAAVPAFHAAANRVTAGRPAASAGASQE